MVSLENVKAALGVTGDYQDDTLTVYYNEVIEFLRAAGVADKDMTDGLIARGVSDLWNYGEGKFSPYFMQRAIQLAYKK